MPNRLEDIVFPAFYQIETRYSAAEIMQGTEVVSHQATQRVNIEIGSVVQMSDLETGLEVL